VNEEQPTKRYRGQRGPNKVPKPKMRHLSLRLPEPVYDFYNGSSQAMRDVLIAWSEGRLVGSIERRELP